MTRGRRRVPACSWRCRRRRAPPCRCRRSGAGGPCRGRACGWRGARAGFAAGFRPGDIILNTFSYHLTPGGFIFDSSARALGCAVIPGGPGNTEQQFELIETYRPAGYSGTPDFLKILLDAAEGLAACGVQAAIKALRTRLEKAERILKLAELTRKTETEREKAQRAKTRAAAPHT